MSKISKNGRHIESETLEFILHGQIHAPELQVEHAWKTSTP